MLPACAASLHTPAPPPTPAPQINAAQRLRLAAYEQSEADKVRIVKAAEADAEAKYLAGQGIARQRQVRGSAADMCLCPPFRCPCRRPPPPSARLGPPPLLTSSRPHRTTPAQAIIAGLRESVQTFQSEVSDVNSRDVMELLLITQYFDTRTLPPIWRCCCRCCRRARLELAAAPAVHRGCVHGCRPARPFAPPPAVKDIGLSGKSNTVFMNHSPGTLGDVSAQIRGGFMQAMAAAPQAMQR